jgi:nitric oxide reductase NorQ protein
VSCNPGYQSLAKELKPSTRQRFVTIHFDLPRADQETAIVVAETGAPRDLAAQLVQVASRIRPLRDRGLTEAPSTRLLVQTAILILAGIAPRRAVETALAAPLTDDPELLATIREIVAGVLG